MRYLKYKKYVYMITYNDINQNKRICLTANLKKKNEINKIKTNVSNIVYTYKNVLRLYTRNEYVQCTQKRHRGRSKSKY